MNKDETDLIKRFKQNARPADRVPFILQEEIISVLAEIRDELQIMNKAGKPVGRPKKNAE